MRRLDPTAAVTLATDGGAVLVDLREVAVFSAGHPAGAVSVEHDPRHLAERVAAVTRDVDAVVLIADEAGVLADAERQLTDAERTTVAGTVNPAAWRHAGLGWQHLEEVAVNDLVDPAESWTVLDVREPLEWATGCIPDAIRVPLGELGGRLDTVPSDTPLAVICESGLRSATGASLLLAAGRDRVANAAPGMASYRTAGHPLEVPEDDV